MCSKDPQNDDSNNATKSKDAITVNANHTEKNATNMPRYKWLHAHAGSLRVTLESIDVINAPCFQRPPEIYPDDIDDEAIAQVCSYDFTLPSQESQAKQASQAENCTGQTSVGDRALTEAWYVSLSWTKGTTGVRKKHAVGLNYSKFECIDSDQSDPEELEQRELQKLQLKSKDATEMTKTEVDKYATAVKAIRQKYASRIRKKYGN